MKTIAFIALITISNVSFALGGKSENAVSSELNVQIRSLEDGMILVKFDKKQGETVRVKILDSTGELLYNEKDKQNSKFAKRYNISALPSGKYTYVVANKVYSIRKVMEKK